MKVTIYHKPCLTCEFDDWHLVEDWAQSAGIKLKSRRTEYNPLWHQKATEIWGDEMYPPFMVGDSNNYITVEYAIEKIKAKELDDLQNLFGTKKRARKSRKVVESKKTTKKDKEKA